MSKDADVDRLTIEEMCEAAIRLDSHSVPRNRRWTRQKAEALRDLALSALEVPVMAGPRGMQKAYDKGFADGQEKTWKAVQENTSVRPDYISSQANAHGEQPRPTDSSPATALSQEAVRDEALEEAARVCDETASVLVIALAKMEDGDTPQAQAETHLLGLLAAAKAIRALKREPNAAAESYDAVHPKALDEPAAPVAKALTAISKAEEVVFNAAIVADDRMRYEEAKNHRKLCDALKEAAALLAKLGQGWISVSERLPEENMRVLVRRGRGTDLFNPCVARYHYQTGRGEWWQYEPDFVSATQPTHWMPLPPAPGVSDD